MTDFLNALTYEDKMFAICGAGILGNAYAIFSLYSTFAKKIEDLKADLRAGGQL